MEGSHAVGAAMEARFGSDNAGLGPEERISAYNRNMSEGGWVWLRPYEWRWERPPAHLPSAVNPPRIRSRKAPPAARARPAKPDPDRGSTSPA